MKSTSGFFAFASVLALACSGGSSGGGAGGAGGGGAVAGPPAQQAAAAPVKLGSQPPPKNPAGVPPNASGSVRSTTQPPPSNPSAPPSSASDSYPGEGIAGLGGGNCDDICKAAASACPAAGTTDNIAGCQKACEAALPSGCVTELAAFLGCAVALGCAQGFDNVDSALQQACASQISLISSCDPNLLDNSSGMGMGTGGSGGTVVTPGQGTGGAPGGATTGCAGLQSCCGMLSADLAPTCMQAYTGAMAGGDTVCNQLLGTYQAARLCP